MRPLQGIRVLDLSRLLPGPFSTLILADLGATVDKLEDTGGGDYVRFLNPQVAGTSIAFHLLNRDKRSAVMDLKKPAAKQAFLRLVRSYDVLFDPFRPGVLDRLGLGHQTLLAENPRLIVCALTGYGQTGPLAQRAGHDLNYLSRSGILGAQGPTGAPPQVPAAQMADIGGGLWCAIAVLAALAERERTGAGRVLDIAMTDGLLGFSITTLANALGGAASTRGAEGLTGGIAAYQTYLSSDGFPISLAALEPKFWMMFCGATGLPQTLDGLMPGPHQAEMKKAVAAVFAAKTRQEWIAFSEKHDCCVEAILDPSEIVDDPHLKARGLFFSIPSPGGDIPQIRLPITSHAHAPQRPPQKGEHTRAILADAGFSEAEIDALFSEGAVKDS